MMGGSVGRTTTSDRIPWH